VKKHILDRYTRTADHQLIIDITANKVEDLYNNFDKQAPYVKKELDPEFADYLIDSVNDIGKTDFVIQFHFNVLDDEHMLSRVEKSIHSYFLYLIDREFKELSAMTRSTLILFCIGVVFLSLSVWAGQKVEGAGSVFAKIIAEGLTVAAWVSLWNAIANFLINWIPHHRQIGLFKRISSAQIVFVQSGQQDMGEHGSLVV